MKTFPVVGDIRKRIGYVLEKTSFYDSKVWVADQDINNHTNLVVVDDVQQWLYGLVNPISKADVEYSIIYNRNKDSDNNKWIAKYISKFDGNKYSVAIEYGATPEEAITKVHTLVSNVIQFLKKEEG